MKKIIFFIALVCIVLSLLFIRNTSQEGRHIKALIKNFHDKSDSKAMRYSAYQEVVEIGEPAVPFLVRALHSFHTDIRLVSVEALGAIGSDESIDGLLVALHDFDKNVRMCAVCFLGKVGKNSKETIPALKKMLYDSNPEVVWYAISALNELGDVSYKKDTKLVNRLCLELKSYDFEKRQNSALALGMIGNKKACMPLVEALIDSTSGTGNYRNTISKALADINSRDAVHFLIEILKDDTGRYKKIQSSVSEVLWQLADPNINNDLLILTESSDVKLREMAARALGFSDNKDAVVRLSGIAKDVNEANNTRESAVVSLGRIGDPNAVDALIIALQAKDDNIRNAAARSLGEFKTLSAINALINALNEPNVLVKMSIVESLGKIGDKSAIEPIVRLFDSDNDLKSCVTNPLYANVPTVAHHALIAITKEDVLEEEIIAIYNKEQLDNIRNAWRKKLKK